MSVKKRIGLLNRTAEAWTKVNPNPAPFKPEPLNGIFMQGEKYLRKHLGR